MPTEEDTLYSFINSISAGDRDAIYPILHYCLSNQEILKERMYLAPLLTPIQLPLDVTMTQRDDALAHLAQRYQSLQDEFKDVHSRYATMKKEEKQLNQKSMRYDFKTLQDEKVQLLDKIGDMEDKVGNSAPETFQRLLDATSMLRKEQDEEMRLRKRVDDQNRALESAKMKLKQVNHRHESIQALHGDHGNDASVDSILHGLQREVVEVTMTVRSDLVSERSALQEKIELLEQERDRPLCTEDDLEQIIGTRQELQEEYEIKSSLLGKEKTKSSHGKIVMFQRVRSYRL